MKTLETLKTLAQLCTPKPSVFDRTKLDVVLDISDLIEGSITPNEFFQDNYLTDGMQHLLSEAFRRLAGVSEQGVFVLTQAMGGGKTHNMIALGLLAEHPGLRKQVMGDLYQVKKLDQVRVVGFTGRESDAPLGIWGSIAEQLGKKELFKDYYSPLSAPGQSAWINLLKGEPLLILLDELPPYLQNAKAKTIGNSDLSKVTTTALSNLLVAVNKKELSNVCVVISDLKATYEGGSQQILSALEDLKSEVNRSALVLEPVRLNSNELYHILRKRLFDTLPSDNDIAEVAQGYLTAVNNAKQMDITNASPQEFSKHIKESYPFHFAIKDLYARFRENPGFQQTRGLIRFMRVVVAKLYEAGKAEKIHLIHPHDIDLNDQDTISQIVQINPTLTNAISHDIASAGQAIAEILDAKIGRTDTQDVCKLILVSSLANIPNSLLGLSVQEIISFMCAPGRDVSKLKNDVLMALTTKAWYLHPSREGKLFFKNVQNLVAKLKSTAESYNRQSSLKELRKFLETIFSPKMKDCYQEVIPLPAVDEIKVNPDKVSLIICEPCGSKLNSALNKFYDDLTYKNRVIFLSGEKGSLDSLIEITSELKAISYILDEMEAEKIADNDPQKTAANEMQEKIKFRLLSALKETFTTLIYPHGDELMNADFLMNFQNNEYNGEKQVRDTLKDKQKFTEDISSDAFRKKCEQRLFTQKEMLWSEVKKRSATNPLWQWHKIDALDLLKADLVHKDIWREHGNYTEKGPFPKPKTEVRVQELSRNDESGTSILKITPVHGDTLHYEIDAPATPGSDKVPNPLKFETSELHISFLCVDSKGEHETGEPSEWKNKITLKSRIYQSGTDKMLELKAAPNAPLRYTTDGSDPKSHGSPYDAPFPIPPGTTIVLAVAEKKGILSEVLKVSIDWEKTEEFTIDPLKPARWKREHSPKTTSDSYVFINLLKKHGASAIVPRIYVGAGKKWVELSFAPEILIGAEKLEETVEYLRGLLEKGDVAIEAFSLQFPTGQALLDWVNDVKTTIKSGEVEQ